MAAAAMEAANALASTDQYGRTIVTETRKFAGQNIEARSPAVFLRCTAARVHDGAGVDGCMGERTARSPVPRVQRR